MTKCLWCNKEFKSDDSRKKCCSHPCAVRRWKREKYPEIGKNIGMEKKCNYCGKKFKDYTKNSTKKYCRELCNDRENFWSLLWDIKVRAKKKGWEFKITKKDIIIPEKCSILGIPLKRHSKYYYNQPNIDRIDNSKGYTKDNIQIISRAANQMKCDMPLYIWNQLRRKLKCMKKTLEIRQGKKNI